MHQNGPGCASERALRGGIPEHVCLFFPWLLVWRCLFFLLCESYCSATNAIQSTNNETSQMEGLTRPDSIRSNCFRWRKNHLLTGEQTANGSLVSSSLQESRLEATSPCPAVCTSGFRQFEPSAVTDVFHTSSKTRSSHKKRYFGVYVVSSVPAAAYASA